MKNINIEFKVVFLCLIALYIFISFILSFFWRFVYYKKLQKKSEIFITILSILVSMFFAFVGSEGILKFSTLFLHKRNASLECVQVTGTAYRT